jgi:hypothetical protein
LINIFYNGITFEMRSAFVNEDYSRSLMYFQIALDEEEQISNIKDQINDVVDRHQPFIPTSELVFVDSMAIGIQNFMLALKFILPFVILSIGFVTYILLLNKVHELDIREDQEINPIEGEAIFEDITDYEEFNNEDNFNHGPPPPFEP